MIDYKTELTGTISDCSLVSSGKSFITLQLDSPYDLEQLEHKIDLIKELPPENPWEEVEVFSDRYTIYKDRVIDGCNALFETNNIPSLKGSFRDLDYDDQAIGKRARVLGKLERMRGGNVCLFFHLVDDAPRPLTQFEIEEQEDYTGLVDEDF